MNRLLTTACFLAFTAPALLTAQERHWAGGSTGVIQVDVAGSPIQTVPPGSNRAIAVAPDGKVWIVAAGVTILNGDGTPFRTVAPSAGISPYAIAFDRAGNAWVSGGAGVEQFDALGNSLGTTALPANPLGITVDTDDNKWIAHRSGPPGSLSRIDGTTGALTNHPLPTSSLILPITVWADARGPLTSSHVWVLGDNRGAGELVEFDAAGNHLVTHVLGASARLQWMSGDVDATGTTRTLWVGDWSFGVLYQVDAATGASTAYAQGAGVYGVTMDGFGNPWITIRTGGLLRRIDPTTGALEVETAVGASTKLATRWQRAIVVDQLGDLDGDGAANLAEAMNGSSPFDACSTPVASLSIEGATSLGAVATIAVRANAGVPTGLAFALGSVQPGLPVPGIQCTFQLDLTRMLGVDLVTTGPASIPLAIPNDPGLVGVVLAVQGLNLIGPSFTNVAAMRFF